MDNEIKQHKALDERTTMIKNKISGTARNFVVIGFYLKEIRDNEYFRDNGYKSLYEYADTELNMSKSTVSRFMAINDRFGVGKELKGNYADYTVSQLSEMLTLTDEQLQEVTVGTTVAEIRDMKRSQPEEKVLEPERSVKKSKRIEDNHEPIPSEESDWETGIFTNDKEPYGWFRSEVVYAFYKDLCNNAIETDQIASTFNLCANRKYLFSCLNRNYSATHDLASNTIKIYEIKHHRFEDDEDAKILTVTMERIRNEYQDYLDANESYKDPTDNSKTVESSESQEASQEVPQVETEPIYEQQKLVATSQLEEQAAVPEKVVAEIIDKPKDKPNKTVTYSIEDYIKYTDADIQSKLYQCDYDMQHYEKDKNKTHQPAITTMIQDALNLLQKHRKENFEYPNNQPELPVLKNNELRRRWIIDYRAWGIWYTDDKTEQRYYKYDFYDGSRLVAVEHKEVNHFKYEKKAPSEYAKTSQDFHLIEPGGHLARYPHSITEIIEFLKNLQKRK